MGLARTVPKCVMLLKCQRVGEIPQVREMRNTGPFGGNRCQDRLVVWIIGFPRHLIAVVHVKTSYGPHVNTVIWTWTINCVLLLQDPHLGCLLLRVEAHSAPTLRKTAVETTTYINIMVLKIGGFILHKCLDDMSVRL